LPASLDLVGPQAMTTDELTSALRRWLGIPARPFVPVPEALLRLASAVGTHLPNASLTRETLALLSYGNTADPAPLATTLGWSPRHLADALAAEPSTPADVVAARMLPLKSLLLGSLAFVWIGSGIASFLVTPERAAALLAAFGLSQAAAAAVTWSGALLDTGLGVAMLFPAMRSAALTAQLATMAVYTVLATFALPGMWLDPFGSLLKNAAVFACGAALLAMGTRS
jgi:hypothetical protein